VKDKMRVNPVGFKTIDKKNFFCCWKKTITHKHLLYTISNM
jgi:hypothetical protein